jgi:bis(5'-nucleosyl)-tetraphosphatase (symmetrical)
MVSLVEKINLTTPHSAMIFVGDLVNRGSGSLEALRFIRQLGSRARVLLGNHDLHLLAVANGVRKAHRSDTLGTILNAPDCADLLDWLRLQPLAMYEGGHLLVHAGVLPSWTVEQTLRLAEEVSQVLRGSDWVDFLRQMYGNTPDQWDDNLQGPDRWRCVVNALTRVRFCSAGGRMDFSSTEGSEGAPPGMMPWFEVAGRQTAATPVVFGHWSTLGLTIRDNLVGLDTGCVWGGKLSAVALDDHSVIQVDCPQYQKPGK